MGSRLLIACFAVVAFALPAGARMRCLPGTFVVHAGEHLLPGTAASYDVLRVATDGKQVMVGITGACLPTRAHAHGARLTASWPRYACGVARRVRFKAVLGEPCEIARGRVQVAGSRPVPFTASRCADDSVVSAEAGEQCAASDACGPDARCIDCRCVAPVDFARDVLPIFQGCLTAACHEGPQPTGGFQLTPDVALAQLLARASRSGACQGRPLVVPGDPDASVLVLRTSGVACGPRMPLGNTPLPAAQVDAIRAWVAEGAPTD